nr:hypothetical protein GCM10020092_013390 [Actinoplanes digitatis]
MAPKPVPTTPAPKAGDVLLSKIVYNSPGKDTGSNTSLNAEYVRLLNTTKATINLKGWTVRDAAGHVYTVTTDQRVAVGAYVYLHTGKGTNGRPDARHRYWNRTGYVWNNGGDTAYLRTPAKQVDRHLQVDERQGQDLLLSGWSGTALRRLPEGRIGWVGCPGA